MQRWSFNVSSSDVCIKNHTLIFMVVFNIPRGFRVHEFVQFSGDDDRIK
jgi:hypothetical protein